MRPVVSVICPGHNSALTVTYCLLLGIGKVRALTLEPAPVFKEGAVGPGGPCCPCPGDDFSSISLVSYLLSDLSDGPEDADAPVGPDVPSWKHCEPRIIQKIFHSAHLSQPRQCDVTLAQSE